MNAPDAKKATLDLGAMMDETLDNIQEAPDFNNPPPGLYLLECKEAKVDKYTTKKEPDVEKQRLKIIYAVSSTVELASQKEPPVPDGSLFSETFQATEEGLSYFKKRIREIMNASDLAGVSLGDMMNSVKGTIFKARLTIRVSKGDNGQDYENVNIRVIPPSEA